MELERVRLISDYVLKGSFSVPMKRPVDVW